MISLIVYIARVLDVFVAMMSIVFPHGSMLAIVVGQSKKEMYIVAFLLA